jgi:hypothetical protein
MITSANGSLWSMQGCKLLRTYHQHGTDRPPSSSIGIIIYGYAMFQKRLTMISARDAGQFGA